MPTTGITYATTPLTFPYHEVSVAVTACETVAAAVLDDLRHRPAASGAARAGWVGAHRTEFDRVEAELYGRLGDLRDQLLMLARALSEVSSAAGIENRRRAERRAAVEAEHRRAERAAALAAAGTTP